MNKLINYIQLFSGLFLFVLFLSHSNEALATHNRAGEITYEQIGDLTIRATIVTYTRTSSFAADRDSLTLYWGDGDSTFVLRSNGNGLELPNDIKRNEYVSQHTYPARGTYTMSVEDPNRIAGILNIDFPNSVNIRFYIETTFTLLEPRFQGRNNSIVLLQPPIDLACVGQVYTYNPNAYDPDGDSLSYELVVPRANRDNEVPNYQLPDEISAGPENQIFLNEETGDFIWNAPQTQGEYNITYRINEYRNGTLINSLLRDMQILVRGCLDENNAPDLEAIDLICVIAGENVEIDIFATDIDSNEVLTITASGGPFELDANPAVLTTGLALDNSMLEGKIEWQTSCDDISREFYQIVVRVTDDRTNPMSGLATLKTLQIKVMGPSPEDVQAENTNNVVNINWSSPYACETTDLFQGFSVWRRIGSSNVRIDTCQEGLEGQGFEKIVFLTDAQENGRYFAFDAELEPGHIYCYRVLAEFALLTDDGNLYNRTQSLPSEEFCIRSSGDEPLITNVSILNTDENGSLDLRWINPNSEGVDTTILSGPYNIIVKGIDNLTGTGLLPITSYSYASGQFGSITDTTDVFTNLDTRNTPHSFQVTFESGTGMNSFKGLSDVASSVYLSSIGRDQSVALSWEENVPWNNFIYYIHEVRDNSLILRDSTFEQSLDISGLTNGEEYCYLVESHGRYGLREVNEPLINFSNESCSTAMDDMAPCAPALTVSSVCESNSISPGQELINTIILHFSSSACQAAPDLRSIKIFFASDETGSLELLVELDPDELTFDHRLIDNISGCYSVTAADQSGNESALIERICVDNCPSYILPNTFSPNGDNANDLFVPRQNRFIDRVEFNVFNRWGQKVFETEDPALNWDGTNLSDRNLDEGTYFYTCKVFERRVTGIEEADILKGTIQLIR